MFFDVVNSRYKSKVPFFERKSIELNIAEVAKSCYVFSKVSGVSGNVLFELFAAKA